MRLALRARARQEPIEGGGIDGLCQVVIEAGRQCAALVVFLAPTGQGDQAQGTIVLLLSDLAGDLVTVEFRQSDVEQHHVGMKGGNRPDGFESVVGGLDHVPLAAQEHGQAGGGVEIVIDDEDTALGARARAPARARSRPCPSA